MVVINRMRLGQTFVPNVFIDRYMVSAGGEYVKVYLMLLRQLDEGGVSVKNLASLLKISEEEVIAALGYWEKQGLLAMEYDGENLNRLVMMDLPDDKSDLEVEDTVIKKPPVKKNKIDNLRNTDEDFKQLVYVAEQYLGRTLTRTDTDMIVWIYDELGFSTDLTEYLIEYCVENGHRSVNYIRTVALRWHEQGITDVKSAKNQVKEFSDNSKGKTAESGKTQAGKRTYNGNNQSDMPSRYSSIIRIYDERKVAAKKAHEARLKELYSKIPAYKEMDEELARLFYEKGMALLGSDEKKISDLEKKIASLHEEKECLLVSAGFPKNYDKIQYTCSKCEDTGYVDGRKCSCFIELEAKRKQA